ncbi:MAG: CHASE2 domain-containing protein [bacterium]|nr:CHASE2 domain-containing protein [bacterium]
MKECPTCHRCLDDRCLACPDDGTPLEAVFVGSCTLDGKYRLVKRLGRGGMGSVYAARHLGLQRLGAVKILRPGHAGEERFVRRFRREAEALGRLRHANVVEVTDFGVDPARQLPYLVMEHLEGLSLAARLRVSGPLAPDTALAIFEQIAAALAHAHGAGILHRDLKPSNVFLVGGDSGAPLVKVLDFGLARFFADPEETPVVTVGGRPAAGLEGGEALSGTAPSPLTAAGTLLGTPGYIAPELLKKQDPIPASDVYAFGVLIYATLVGRPPFEELGTELNEMHLHHQPPRPSALRPELDGELDGPLVAALAKDPAARPASPLRVVAGLREAARRARRRRWRRREAPQRLALALLLGLAAALLVGILGAPLQGLENRLVDARFFLSPPRPPRHPLLLVLIDDPTLAGDPAPLIDKGDEMGELMQRVLGCGAAGVGIDLLLPAQWSRSAAFSELVLRYPDALALAAFSPPEGPVVGPEAVSGLTAAALGPLRAREIFGFVNLDEDDDAVVRRARAGYRDVHARPRASFAGRIARILLDREAESSHFFRIDFTLDWQRFESISWRDLAAVLERGPERFRDRFVLVGAVYTGAGDAFHRVPHPRDLPAEIPGPMLQAVIVHTLLDGTPVRVTPVSLTLASAGLMAALAAAAMLLVRRLGPAISPGPTLTAGWIAGAYAGFVHGRVLLPVASLVVVMLITTAMAVVLRRRLAGFPE